MKHENYPTMNQMIYIYLLQMKSINGVGGIKLKVHLFIKKKVI